MFANHTEQCRLRLIKSNGDKPPCLGRVNKVVKIFQCLSLRNYNGNNNWKGQMEALCRCLMENCVLRTQQAPGKTVLVILSLGGLLMLGGP